MSIQIPLADGGHLSGIVDTIAGRDDCVLFVHGFDSKPGSEKAVAFREASARAGRPFAAFSFRGHGASSGSFLDLCGSGLQSDLDAVASFLAERGMTRLYLVGSSMGGFASAWFALRHPEVQAMVLLAPALRFLEARWQQLSVADQQEWARLGKRRFAGPYKPEGVELAYAFVAEREQFRWQELADRWRTPTLIFHGMRDDVVPYQDTVALMERTRFGQLETRLIRDGDHRLTQIKERMAREGLEFFAM